MVNSGLERNIRKVLDSDTTISAPKRKYASLQNLNARKNDSSKKRFTTIAEQTSENVNTTEYTTRFL